MDRWTTRHHCALLCSAVLHCHSAVQCSAVQCCTVQCCTVPFALHSAAQDTIQKCSEEQCMVQGIEKHLLTPRTVHCELWSAQCAPWSGAECTVEWSRVHCALCSVPILAQAHPPTPPRAGGKSILDPDAVITYSVSMHYIINTRGWLYN